MKKIYSISKGQLIILWIFGIIGWYLALRDLFYSPLLGEWLFYDTYGYGAEFFAWEWRVANFFVLLIPFVLIFYTLGWKKWGK